MSPYTPLPQTSPPKPNPNSDNQSQDLLEGLQNIPSNFELALNHGTNRTYLTPGSKAAGTSLLDPEAFRRLSISSVASTFNSRGISPFLSPENIEPKTWRGSFWNFWHRNQGLFLVTFSQLFGALMNVTTRLLELEGEGMHPFQILFARQGLTFIFCSAWMWWKRVPDFPFGARSVRKLLCVRAFSGFFGIYGMYYSLQYLPVADAVVLTFLAPSVASYACYIFLHEPFPRYAQYASLVSLTGVILIACPTSLFSSSSPSLSPSTNSTVSTIHTTNDSFPTPTSAQRMSAVGVAMIGVLGSAGAYTSIRWIGSRAHPLISVNYFALFCTLISTLALSISKPLHLSSSLHFALPVNVRQWSMLIFLGICGFVMQFLLTKGLAVGGRGGGARLTDMIYTNMLFALALDKLVFGQSPGWWSLGGSGLILGSAVVVAIKRGSGEVMRETDEENGGDEERAGRERGHRDGGTEEEEMRMLGAGAENEDEDEAERDGVGLREFQIPRSA